MLIAPEQLSDRAQAWGQQICHSTSVLWDILAPAALVSRSFSRDCVRLSYIVPPSSEHVCSFLGRCLSDETAIDSFTIAALVAFAANAGCTPGSDAAQALVEVLAHLAIEVQAQVAGHLQHWSGPIHADVLVSWTTLVNFMPSGTGEVEQKRGLAAAALSPATPTVPSLRDLLSDAPSGFLCCLDGRLLVDPVRSPSGHIFERSSLKRALEGNGGICPISQAPLTMEECLRDVELRAEILRWVRRSRPRQSSGRG